VETLDGVQVTAAERKECEDRWEKSANRQILAAGTDEIVAAVQQRIPIPTPPAEPPAEPPAVVPAAAPGSAQQYEDIFDRLDRNHDQNLTPREIILGLRKYPEIAADLGLETRIKEGATRDTLMAMFIEMDINQDDQVSKREFVKFEIKVHSHVKELREINEPEERSSVGNLSVTEIIEKTAEKIALGDDAAPALGDETKESQTTEWKNITPRKAPSPSPKAPSPVPPSPLVSEQNVAGSIQLVAKRLASPSFDSANNGRGDATIDSGANIVEKIKEESGSLSVDRGVGPSSPATPLPPPRPPQPAAATGTSLASDIANQTHFLGDDGEDEDEANNSRSLFQDYGDSELNTSTSSITGALLAAHRKNKFLEEELKRERKEREDISGTVKALQSAVDEIRNTGGSDSIKKGADGDEIEKKTDKWQEKVNNSQISISLLELRANDAEETASLLQKQLVEASQELANTKEMAGEERKLLMKDIAVLTSSRKVINDVSTTLYTNSAVRNLDERVADDTIPPPTLFTTASQREAFAAKVAIKLHEALASTQVVMPSDMSAKACVDAALQCIDSISGFSIAFSTTEEKVKQSRDRLESLNKRLGEESSLLKSTMGEVEKYETLKMDLTTDYNSLVHQLRTEKERLERIKSRRDEEEAEAKHSLEKCTREIELTLKRSDAERERLAILKGEVDGEQEHLKQLRQVAEAEFNALQKNVEALAKKAGDVKEDISEKRLVAERLKDKINHLKDVQYEQQKGFDESTARGEKELERLRAETRRVEDTLSDLREEVNSRRLREEEKLESLRSHCDKYQSRNLSAREDYALEKRGQEEKRRRWAGEIEDLKKEVNERQSKLGDVRREIEDSGLKAERLRKIISISERRLSEVNSKVEMNTEDLIELESKKSAVQDELNSNIVSMEDAIHQGKLVSEKLKVDSDRLRRLETTHDEKNGQLESMTRKLETIVFHLDQKQNEYKVLETETFRKKEEVEGLTKQIASLESSREEMRFIGAEKERLEKEQKEVEGIVLAEMEKHSALNSRTILLKGEVTNLERKKEQEILALNKLEGDTKALTAESSGLQDGIVSRKALEKSLGDTIVNYTEKSAVLEAKTKSLALKAREVEENLKSKENELRSLEHMIMTAQGKREIIQRDHMKLERDLKESRSIENELSMLRRSRDMASAEAMRAEESSLYAREKLRELEGRVLRERGGLAENTGGRGGGGGDRGGGLRLLKERLDQSTSSE